MFTLKSTPAKGNISLYEKKTRLILQQDSKHNNKLANKMAEDMPKKAAHLNRLDIKLMRKIKGKKRQKCN